MSRACSYAAVLDAGLVARAPVDAGVVGQEALDGVEHGAQGRRAGGVVEVDVGHEPAVEDGHRLVDADHLAPRHRPHCQPERWAGATDTIVPPVSFVTRPPPSRPRVTRALPGRAASESTGRSLPLMADPVLQTVPLGFQWATVDPFLFCVHHLDPYPAGNEHMGPAASLEGRDLGMDFAGADGWRMYHGSTVPGLPAAPPPGLRDGDLRPAGLHRPLRLARCRPPASAGATCSGSPPASGIVHSEMFPLLDRDGPEPVRAVPDLAQPAGRRQDGRALLHDAVGRGHPAPRRAPTREGRTTEVTVIAGALAGLQPPPAAAELVGRRDPRPTSPSGTCARARRAVEPPARPTAPTPSARSTCSRGRSRIGEHELGGVDRRGRCAPTSRSPIAGGPTAPRCWCCRAGRSASRWPSTGRS